jgi:hypothetical protein
MRKRLIGCAAMTALLLTAPSAVAAPIIPLDPKTGNIGGRIALAAIPRGTMQLDKRAPCEVHLVPASYDTPEQVFPCNTWFQPRVGRYLFWLEQGAFISYQSVINYGGEEFRRAGMLLSKPLFPAGQVEIRARTIPPGGTLRLLSLRTARAYRPFDRVLAATITARKFRVPAGDVIAGIFDRRGTRSPWRGPMPCRHGERNRSLSRCGTAATSAC